MGFYSWMFADRENEKPLKIGKTAYLLIPTEENGVYEGRYDGYGNIGNLSVYEQVALWNRDNLSEENLEKPDRKRYGDLEDSEEAYQRAMKYYEMEVARLKDFVSGMSKEELNAKYGKYALYELGISVACYNWQNAKLKYPIKICEKKSSAKCYNSLPASKLDPNQGCD